MPKLVPVYEEREAARFCLYSWTEWGRLTMQERAEAVAHYRLNRLVEMHRDDTVAMELKRRGKGKG